MTNEFDEKLQQLSGIVERMDAIAGYGRRTRRLARVLLVSFILDIALTLGLTFLYNQTHQSQLDACHVFGNSRRDQIGLWSRITSLIKGPHARQFDQRLNDIVHKTFRPLNCSAIYHTQPFWVLLLITGGALAIAAGAGWYAASRRTVMWPKIRRATITQEGAEIESGRKHGS